VLCGLCGLWMNGVDRDVRDVYVRMLTFSVLEDVGYGLYFTMGNR